MNERRVKILFAIPRFSVGGAEKLLVHQLRALNHKHFAPTLITLFEEQNETLAGEAAIDRCFAFQSTLDITRLPSLFKYMRRGNFDVVVTHLFSANLLVRIVAVLSGVRVIVSYEHNIYPNKRAWQIFMDWLLSKWTDRIIVDSDAARIFTAKQENIPLEKFVTLYIPPLLERRAPKAPAQIRRELRIPEGHRVVLTVSRLVSDKGHTNLIDAAMSVLLSQPETVFLLVGWGPLQEALAEQAKRLGISDKVLLPGRLDIEDVLPLADVYVDPAVSTDLPVAIMEAMREGKPIVATRVGDIPAFIEHGVTGLLADPRDSDTLARHIATLLDDKEQAARMGNAARTRVAKYSLSEYMKTFEVLILSLYEQKRKN